MKKIIFIITSMLILVSCNSNVQDDITPESSPKSEQTEFEHDAILEKNQKFCEENEKLKNNRLNYSPDTFYPELNELTGVYYHNETDTTICIEMLTAPGARAISEYFVTIQTKTDEGNDIVFQDVPAYSASVTEYDGCLMVSLGSCYSTYTGILLLEYEKHDQIYYTLRSDIDGCVDTGDSIVSVENVTQAADLPQYKNYILDEATARSLIYDYYPDKQISDMARYMSPQETEEAMNILYENQWYKNDTNEKWSLHESLIHYEIIAAYNLDDMAYSIYYYDRYAPGALCCASIPLQYGDPWRPIDIYIPDSTGTLIYNSYLSMSHDEIEQYKVEEGYDVFEPDFDLREFIDNLFTEYEDISEYEVLSVGQFYNGIAYFVLDDVTYTGTWQGTEYINGKYGYVNTEGKVIVPPIYTQAPTNGEFPLLVEYQTKKDGVIQTHQEYRNLDGSTAFAINDNMLHMGCTANGMFWVVTETVKLTGNEYCITYYDTSCNELFTIKNATYADKYAITRLVYDTDSNFNQYGYAIISANGIDKIIDSTGNILDFNLSDNFYQLHDEVSGGEIVSVTEFISCGSNISLARGIIYDSNGNWKSSCDLLIDFKTMTLYRWNIQQKISECVVYNDYIIAYDYDDLFNTTIYYQSLDTKLWSFKDIAEFSPAIITQIYAPAEDMLVVRMKNKDNAYFSAIVDINGNLIMEPQNNIYVIQSFSEGMCIGYIDNDYGFADKAGNWLIPPDKISGTPIAPFHNGITETMTFIDGDTIISVIDTNGNTLFTYKW